MILAIIGWMLFGLIIGAVARLLYPGRQPLGILGTMLLGIAGSFAGGFIAYLIFGGTPLQASGWIGSLIGAVLLIAISGYTTQHRIQAH